MEEFEMKNVLQYATTTDNDHGCRFACTIRAVLQRVKIQSSLLPHDMHAYVRQFTYTSHPAIFFETRT
jgi:hypothetical protein